MCFPLKHFNNAGIMERTAINRVRSRVSLGIRPMCESVSGQKSGHRSERLMNMYDTRHAKSTSHTEPPPGGERHPAY